jgi:DNA-binding NarL/FixJ family response regulator
MGWLARRILRDTSAAEESIEDAGRASEIAARLRLSLGTVKTHIRRGMM